MISTCEPANHITTTNDVAAMDDKPPTAQARAFTIRLRPDIAEHLTDEAWRQRRSRSDLIAEIVGDWCEVADAS